MLSGPDQVSVQRRYLKCGVSVFQDCRKRMLGDDIEWWLSIEAAMINGRW